MATERLERFVFGFVGTGQKVAARRKFVTFLRLTAEVKSCDLFYESSALTN
jgi:hypothetical protein